MQSTLQLSRAYRHECKPRPDGSCRSSSFGEVLWSTRRQSPSWNLGRAKQGDTIRVDGTSPQGRGQDHVKESDKGVLPDCRKVKYKTKPLSGMLSKLTQQPGEGAARCKTKENDASVTRPPGNDESSKNNPISEEE